MNEENQELESQIVDESENEESIETDETIEPNGEDRGQTEEDILEEIERNGKKYKVSSAIKAEIEEYITKASGFDEQKQQLDQAIRQQQIADQYQRENFQEIAKLVNINDELAQYQKVDWNELSDKDPVKAQKLWINYTMLRDASTTLTGKLHQSYQQYASAIEQQVNSAYMECMKSLLDPKTGIPGFNGEMAMNLAKYAKEKYGMPLEKFDKITDPAIVKIINEQYLIDQKISKAKAKTEQTDQPIRPVTTLHANTSNKRNPDAMSTDDWMTWRQNELKKANKR